MATIATLAVSLRANTAKFDKGMRRAQGRLQRFSSSVGSTIRSVTQIAGALSAVGFIAMGKRALDAADEIQKLAIQTGATTEFLSEMRRATDITGIEFDQFTKGVTRMQKSIGDAKKGLSTAKDAFHALNLNVDDLLALSPDDQFTTIADALSKVGNNAQRTQIAMDIFGRSGAELNRLFVEGAEGIEKYRGEARKAGETITKDMADKAAAANDAFRNLKASIKVLTIELTTALAPSLTKFADFMRTKIKPWLFAIKQAFQVLGKTIGGTAAALKQFFEGQSKSGLPVFIPSFKNLKAVVGIAENLGKDLRKKFNSGFAEEAGKQIGGGVDVGKAVAEILKRRAQTGSPKAQQGSKAAHPEGKTGKFAKTPAAGVDRQPDFGPFKRLSSSSKEQVSQQEKTNDLLKSIDRNIARGIPAVAG